MNTVLMAELEAVAWLASLNLVELAAQVTVDAINAAILNMSAAMALSHHR